LAIVAGEITRKAFHRLPDRASPDHREVGYTRGKFGFDAETCARAVVHPQQSPDIAMGVDTGGRRRPGP